MVNSIVVKYLSEYKEKYPIDLLKKEILSKGYTEKEFLDAINLLTPISPLINKPKLKTENLDRFKIDNNFENDIHRGGFSFGLLFGIIGIIVACGFIGMIILNYLGYDVFGINLFNYF